MFARSALVACLALLIGCPNSAEPPPAPAPPPDILPGLAADYGGARDIVDAPHFFLRDGQTLHPSLQPGPRRATFTGVLRVTEAGDYRFETPTNGEVSLTMDGRAADSAHLDAGDHPIEIGYEGPAGDGWLQVRWSCEHFGSEPIPATAFGHPRDPRFDTEDPALRGHELMTRLNCGACHTGAPGGMRAPDLTEVSRRADARWIYRWLEDPRHFRPEAVMPVMLTDAERADVATFLGGERGADPASDRFRRRRGRDLYVTTGCAACHRVEDADVPGDGALLAGLGSKMNATALAEFLMEPLAADPSGRMPRLGLSRDDASMIAEYLCESRNSEYEQALPAGASADRGRQLVGSRGCLACHSLRGLDNTLTAPALDERAGAAGCLAAAPPEAAPRYALSQEDRNSILAALRSPPRSVAPTHQARRLMAEFRCASCHDMSTALQEAMARRGAAEMGGAQPPSLDEAPFKLRETWIADVLLRNRRIRPWMTLRMPHYGEAVAPIAAGLAAMSGMPPEATAPPPTRVQEGVRLMGRGVGTLGCISCHDFRGIASQGTRGPDMAGMYARIRPEWFERWMRSPLRIQPRTAMPSFFTSTTEEQTAETIRLLWDGLAAGDEMPLPPGIEVAGAIVVAVGDEPLVIRTFLPRCTPRSMAVGLPGGVSLAFDATECRLMYAWTGDFVDAAPAWAGRGGTEANILGELFMRVGNRFPIRFGMPDWSADAAPQFRGYAIRDGAVVMRYEVAGRVVRERFAPTDGGFSRSFEVESPGAPIWFHAGGQIADGWRIETQALEAQGDGVYRCDGDRFSLEYLR